MRRNGVSGMKLSKERLLNMSPSRQYRRFVIEEIIVRCNISPKHAANMVQTSSLPKALKQYPEVVLHYPPEEWAENIIEQKGCCC